MPRGRRIGRAIGRTPPALSARTRLADRGRVTPPAHPPAEPAARLRFEGRLLGPSAVNAQARDWLAALEAAGLEPAIAPPRANGWSEALLEPRQRELVARCVERERRGPAPEARVLHTPAHRYVRSTEHEVDVAIVFFETEGPDAETIARLREADLVLVPCRWARTVLLDRGLEPSRVERVAPPLDVRGLEPPPLHVREPGAPLRWISAFEWSVFAAPEVLLRAFAHAFTRDEAELVLWLPPHPRIDGSGMQSHCESVVRRQAGARAPRILVRDGTLPRTALAESYRGADGFVVASRGECFAQRAHEALLTGLPVVLPDSTGFGDLVPDETYGFLVPTRRTPVSADAVAERPWCAGRHWFEPDLEALVEALREVSRDPEKARERARRARTRLLGLDPLDGPAAVRRALQAVPGPRRAT